jgi:large subunit ribosomal protein L7/L12
MADVKSLIEEAGKLKDEERTQFLTEFLAEQKVAWLANAIKALEEKFGVKAQAATMAVAPAGPAPKEEDEGPAMVDVVLKGLKDPNARLNCIKAVREITKVGLQEAKALVDGAPKPIKEGVPKEEADKIKKDLETAGGQVELK